MTATLRSADVALKTAEKIRNPTGNSAGKSAPGEEELISTR
jgi:hypothetical protein